MCKCMKDYLIAKKNDELFHFCKRIETNIWKQEWGRNGQ